MESIQTNGNLKKWKEVAGEPIGRPAAQPLNTVPTVHHRSLAGNTHPGYPPAPTNGRPSTESAKFAENLSFMMQVLSICIVTHH